jgi:hypothetical protein
MVDQHGRWRLMPRASAVISCLAGLFLGCSEVGAPPASPSAVINLRVSEGARVAPSFVGVTVAYLQSTGGTQLLADTILAISSGQRTFSVEIDVAGCLNDPRHIGGESECTVDVTVTLYDESNIVLDEQILESLVLETGVSTTAPTVTLRSPEIALTATNITFNASGADPPDQRVSVSNSGGGTLDSLAIDSVTYAQASGWLTASLSGITASPSVTLTLQVAATTLVPGSYSALVYISAPRAPNSPVTLTVITIITSGAPSPVVLQPTDLCSDYPASAIATFEDAKLELAVRAALSVGAQDDLTCGLVGTVTQLAGDNAGIVSLVGIQNLTNLVWLWLPNNSITDVTALSGLTTLATLNVDGSSIADIGALSGLTSLTFLRLEGNSITDVTPLRGLTSLTLLMLSNNAISDVNVLSGLTSLTILTLSSNSISDIGALGGLTSLDWLVLPNNAITDISALSGLTSLTYLALGQNSITDISALSGLTNLTRLDLPLNKITDISALSGLASLEDLALVGNTITDISALSGLTSLTRIFLGGTSISDISALSSLTSLTYLALGQNSIVDISALSGLTSLTQLFLQGNSNLTDIQPLLDNTGLGPGDSVSLTSTNVACTDVALLQAKGVTVFSTCP